MNPNLCRVALRPRDPFEVLDLSLRLVRERWRPIARLCLVTVLPVWLLALPLCWWTHGHYALLALPILAAPPIQAPFTVLGGRLLFSDEVRLRRVLRETVSRAPALLAAWIIGGLVIGVAGALTCVALAPFAQAALLYLQEAALLERVPPMRGLRRSTRLAGGNFGNALAGAGSWWAFTAWGAFVGEATGQALVDFVLQLGTPFGTMWGGDVTPWLLGGMLLAQPFHAIYRLLLYVDVRTRVEGWDLQVGLRAAGLAR